MYPLRFQIERIVLCAALGLPALSVVSVAQMAGQTANTGSAAIAGTVLDPRGVPLPGAAVVVRNEATGTTAKVVSDSQGKYAVSGLGAGRYTVQVDAKGFATSKTSVMTAGSGSVDVPVTLQMGNVSEQVTVEANAAGSVAAALAPMDALLDETSARTEITSTMIQNFMSPVADYGEAVEMAPGTFTTNSNGVGLGQSSTYFRGFPDGNYDIDFDGIPFYDTNTPTHHSWAFFPSQFLGGIDFDRSPGTASTIGPTPFGGSIHLLSKDFSPVQNARFQFSGGSFGTYLYDGEYDSGKFGPGRGMSLNVDIHHMQSNGYQTYNHQTRNGGDLQFQYKISDKTVLTGFSAVIWLDANTPNFNATRCQMYGAGAGYTCTGTNAPFAGEGLNFLLTDNSDPLLYLNNEYNYYHVPTDFEYVGLHKEFGHGFALDVKPYTYNYDNSEKYSNAVPITDDAGLVGTTYGPLGVKIPNTCNTLVKSKYTCGVDKYNSYRKYGETGELTQVSKWGVLRAGMWYEWANTNRHQFPADPLQNWLDAPLPNFSETFVTDSYQPFAEYQWNATKKLTVTGGVKWAYYTIGTKQYADNGGKIGGLGTNNPASFITNGGSYLATLPSISANYRLRNNLSVYGQVATGSVVPPSGTFDYTQSATGTAVATLPKQQKNLTYQTGTVMKFKRATLDVDYYHIHFDNSYSSFTPLDTGEPVYYAQPPSVTQGIEGETNLYVSHGLSLYLNASVDSAKYVGSAVVYCNGTKATTCNSTTAPLTIDTPGGLWVANTPSDIETEGVTYQHRSWDAGLFNKRVGTQRLDDSGFHNEATIDPFSLTNMFVNYTIRSGSRFDQTKIRLSLNNAFGQHNMTGDSLATKVVANTINANGTTYADPFNANYAVAPISGADAVSVLPDRSIMLSVTFGLSPKR